MENNDPELRHIVEELDDGNATSATPHLPQQIAEKLAHCLRQGDSAERESLYSLVINDLHGGDFASFRNNRGGERSLRELCKLGGLESISGSRSRIHRGVTAHAVELVLIEKRVVPPVGQHHLTTSHLAALYPLLDQTDTLVEVTKLAIAEGLSKNALTQLVRERRPPRAPRKTHRGSLHADSKLIERLDKGTYSESERRPADPARWDDADLHELRDKAVDLKQWLDTVLSEVETLLRGKPSAR